MKTISNKSLKFHLIPILIFILVGLIFYFAAPELIFTDRKISNSNSVEDGEDYFLMVKLIELFEKKPDGSNWETLSSSAPDLYFEIFWNNNKVYKSEVKENSLLAQWSNAELDVVDLTLKNKNVSVDSITQGARVNITKQGSVEIKIYNNETLLPDKLIAKKIYNLKQLKDGDTIFKYDTNEDGVKRIIVTTTNMKKAVNIFE